jgi:nocturnin
LEEILRVDPDILCLQEVDHFGFLLPVMEKLGYEGSFFPKPSSPCLFAWPTNGPDGCAMFYKISKFASLRKESIVLKMASTNEETNQVCIIYKLALTKQPNYEVTVATTHLKAKHGWGNLRKEQGTYLAKYLLEKVGDKPLVVCGDFNAEKTEPVYNVFCHSPLNLNSAYKLLSEPPGSEPAYTTWKIRGGSTDEENDFCHTIDYVWYTQNSLEVKSLLSIPTGEEMGQDRLPSYQYPSDHFSLATEFVFK